MSRRLRAGLPVLLAGFALSWPMLAHDAQAQVQTAQGPATPVGIWRTYDDDGKPTGKVQITEQDGVAEGRVLAIDDPSKAGGTCLKCTDARKDQPVLGMTVMVGMRPDGAAWDGGRILDPETGSVYRCSMRVEDNGQKLVLRGYLGIALFGRSQTWVRVGG